MNPLLCSFSMLIPLSWFTYPKFWWYLSISSRWMTTKVIRVIIPSRPWEWLHGQFSSPFVAWALIKSVSKRWTSWKHNLLLKRFLRFFNHYFGLVSYITTKMLKFITFKLATGRETWETAVWSGNFESPENHVSMRIFQCFDWWKLSSWMNQTPSDGWDRSESWEKIVILHVMSQVPYVIFTEMGLWHPI